MTAAIRFEVAAPFGELILDQPKRRNALSQTMWAAIPECVAQANANPDVKLVIVHGGDAGAFASGADISEFETIYATREAARQSGSTIAAALNAIETSEKPVIAAIEGACVGGGVSLAMAADLRVAGHGASFGITPGKLGLVYPAGDTARLLRTIGPSVTKDLLFTGRLLNSEAALAAGLIDRLVLSGSALDEARAWGHEIATISQWSVRATKRMIAGLQSGWDGSTPNAEQLFLDGFENEDFKEGFRAFLEKRKPHWKIR